MKSNLLKRLMAKFGAKIPLKIFLIIPFALIICGTVGMVGYLSLMNGREAVKDVANQFLDEVTARVERTLPSYLSVPVRINLINALNIELGKLELYNVPFLEHYFWREVNIYDTVAF